MHENRRIHSPVSYFLQTPTKIVFILSVLYSLSLSARCADGEFEEERGIGVDCDLEGVDAGEGGTFLYRKVDGADSNQNNRFEVVTEFHFDTAPGEQGYYKCGVWRKVSTQEQAAQSFVRWIYLNPSERTQTFPVIDQLEDPDGKFRNADISYTIACLKPFQKTYGVQFEVAGRAN